MKRTALLSLVMILMLMLLTGCESDPYGGDIPTGTGTVTTARFSNGLEYKLSEDGTEYYVIGIGKCKSKKIIIPEAYNDLPVTRIENSAFTSTDIESVILPTTVREIGDIAFKGCENLTSVDLCNVEVISRFAFLGCTALTEMFIPSSVVSIATETFSGCTSLASVTFASDCKITSIESRLFSNCTSLVEISFGNCPSLTTVKDGAFMQCTSLAVFRLPDTVKNIGSDVFNDCYSIKDMYIPRDLTSLGDAFYATEFESITVSPANERFAVEGNCLISKDGDELFRGTNNSIIPDSVDIIHHKAFMNLTKLKEITFPSEPARIGSDIFTNCTSLEYVKVSKGMRSIDPKIFTNCPSLKTLEVDPENPYLRSEGNCIISGSAIVLGCKESVIPEGITQIESNAFQYCAISEITIPNSVTSIGIDAFLSCPIKCINYTGTEEEWAKLTKKIFTPSGVYWFYSFPNIETVCCTDRTITYK